MSFIALLITDTHYTFRISSWVIIPDSRNSIKTNANSVTFLSRDCTRQGIQLFPITKIVNYRFNVWNHWQSQFWLTGPPFMSLFADEASMIKCLAYRKVLLHKSMLYSVCSLDKFCCPVCNKSHHNVESWTNVLFSEVDDIDKLSYTTLCIWFILQDVYIHYFRINIHKECTRLKEGFVNTVKSPSWKRALLDVQQTMKVPEWQRATYFAVSD